MQNEIRTGAFDVVSNNDTTPLFNAMTGPMSTADLKEIRFGLWVSGLTSMRLKVGVQFSNDGITWDTPDTVAIAGGYATTSGWAFNTSFADISALGGGSTYRLFVRFGVQAYNTASVTGTQAGQAELSLQVKPKAANTVTVGPVRAWCTGATAIFIPMSQPINSEDVGELRGTVELLATSGDLGVKCAWREANTPTVPGDWSAATSFGTEATADEIKYGTTFSAPTLTKKYVQFGVVARNTASASVIEAGQATIRIDYRNT